MKVIDSPTNTGPRGHGSIKILDDKRVSVTITEGEKTETHTLEFPQGVAMVKVNNWQLQDADNISIQLTPDKLDFQYSPRPIEGNFYIEFSRFGAEEGELPTIRYSEEGKPFPGAKWENPARYKAYALYEIINPGVYQGMEILDVVTYELEWDENLEEFTIVGSKRKKWHDHFLTFLNVFGFDLQNDTLHYTGEEYNAGGPTTIANVLPEIEDILQSRAKVGQVFVENGWVRKDGLGMGPFGMTKEGLQAAMEQQA